MNYFFISKHLMRCLYFSITLFLFGYTCTVVNSNTVYPSSLDADIQSKMRAYIQQFNLIDMDTELYSNLIPNAASFEFLSPNIPLIDIPEPILEEIYYFRWWTFRKHIKKIPGPIERYQNSNGTINEVFVITEFLPTVSWAGQHNTINCAAGHHFREARWFHDTKYLESYAYFWFDQTKNGGNPRQYSFWPANSVWALFRMHGNAKLLNDLLQPLINNYETLIQTNFDSTKGLFFNTDNRDGMEMSIGSHEGVRAYRPTLNTYMLAEAAVIAKISKYMKRFPMETRFKDRMKELENRIYKYLWDEKEYFFKALPYRDANSKKESKLVNVRELIGYTPWYFKVWLPTNNYLISWNHLVDSKGFNASYGLTTAEQRHPEFKVEYSTKHECQWNGPSWPYATSITLTALANILQGPLYDTSSLEQHYKELEFHKNYISNDVYYNNLLTYAKAHHRRLDDDEVLSKIPATRIIPWIDENIHPYTGDWISRTLLKTWRNGTWSSSKGGKERGKDYNHSTFVDLLLSGLLGFIPRSSNSFEIRPLFQRDKEDVLVWNYFCFHNIKYRGHLVTIMYDKDGSKYGHLQGFQVYVDRNIVYLSTEVPKYVIIKMHSH